MFEIHVSLEFPAGHHLKNYPGNCARPHGHNWKVEVFVQGKTLNKIGILEDFRWLKTEIKTLTDQWDHQDLNQLSAFQKKNPSAEMLAYVLYQHLKPKVKEKKLLLVKVRVWENARSSAAYFEPPAFSEFSD